MTAMQIAAIAWSVAGLVIGYGLGRYHAHVKRRRVAPVTAPTRPGNGPGTAPRSRHRVDRGSLARTGLGLLILLLVVGTTVQLYRTTNCQAGYNTAVTGALAARSDQQSAQLVRQIEQLDAQQLLLAPYDPGASEAARRTEGLRRAEVYRAAVEANRQSLIELRDARVDNPIPDAESCGER